MMFVGISIGLVALILMKCTLLMYQMVIANLFYPSWRVVDLRHCINLRDDKEIKKRKK